MTEGPDHESWLQEIQVRLQKVLQTEFNSVLIGTDSASIAKFLDLHLHREMVILRHVSQNSVIEISTLCLTAADSILKIPPKDMKPQAIFSLCIYYAILTRCLSTRPITGNLESIDSSIARQVVEQSRIVFSSDFGVNGTRIRQCFCQLLSEIGRQSTLIYNAFYQKLKRE